MKTITKMRRSRENLVDIDWSPCKKLGSPQVSRSNRVVRWVSVMLEKRRVDMILSS